ncbi:hypothetical protein AC1031_015376 [Aphanomyces cochlioides]|nr:hypothetical protein AC1031_015376 [Aphanomyces cochlioides]
MNTSVRSQARSKLKTQPTAYAPTVGSARKSTPYERPTPRNSSSAVDRSPPRLTSTTPRRTSVTRLPIDFPSHEIEPTPVRKRAQSESVSEDLLHQVTRRNTASYEQKIAALEARVASLENELISAQLDIAARDFDIHGLQAEKSVLEHHHRASQTVMDLKQASLREKYDAALKRIHEQDATIRQQAKDLEDAKTWIVTHCFDSTHSRPPNPIGHELEALEDKAYVSQSIWSSRFQRHGTTKQQKQIAVHVDSMQQHLDTCIELHKAHMIQAATMEASLAIDTNEFQRLVEETSRDDKRSAEDDKVKKVGLDQLVADLGALIDRFAHVRAS